MNLPWTKKPTPMQPLRDQLAPPYEPEQDTRTLTEKMMEAMDMLLEDLSTFKARETANIERLKADVKAAQEQVKEAENRLKEIDDNIRVVRPASEAIALKAGGKPQSVKDIVDSLEPEIARIGQEAG